jgi:hypothetical protein
MRVDEVVETKGFTPADRTSILRFAPVSQASHAVLHKRHTDASAVFFWWPANPNRILTSFTALSTLSKRFRYARATPSGIHRHLRHTECIEQAGQRARVCEQESSGRIVAPVTPLHQALCSSYFLSPQAFCVFNNPPPYKPSLHSVGLPHSANW